MYVYKYVCVCTSVGVRVFVLTKSDIFSPGMQNNNNINRSQNEDQANFHRCQKGLWQNTTAITDKNTQRKLKSMFNSLTQ